MSEKYQLSYADAAYLITVEQRLEAEGRVPHVAVQRLNRGIPGPLTLEDQMFVDAFANAYKADMRIGYIELPANFDKEIEYSPRGLRLALQGPAGVRSEERWRHAVSVLTNQFKAKRVEHTLTWTGPL